MTTILADFKLGLMVSDSQIATEDRVWSGRKVWRTGGSLVGIAGYDSDFTPLLKWIRGGMVGKVSYRDSSVLILNAHGLFFLDKHYDKPERIACGREAIGTGDKAAMCAYEALGFTDPKRAVSIVCKHDAGSRAPVRVYRL